MSSPWENILSSDLLSAGNKRVEELNPVQNNGDLRHTLVFAIQKNWDRI